MNRREIPQEPVVALDADQLLGVGQAATADAPPSRADVSRLLSKIGEVPAGQPVAQAAVRVSTAGR